MVSNDWDHIRKPYQVHILNLYRLIDLHSEQYFVTQDAFHLEQYYRLVKCLEELKTWIKTKEQQNQNTFK